VTHIEESDLVLRRIPGVWVVEENGLPRPSGQAFNNDGAGEPMSVYLDSVLREIELSRTDVLDGHDGFYLAAVVVQVLLDEEQDIQSDPITPQIHKCDPAHAIVVGDKGRHRRRRIARQAQWIDGLCPPGAVETV
jgi:hypothetical protein